MSAAGGETGRFEPCARRPAEFERDFCIHPKTVARLYRRHKIVALACGVGLTAVGLGRRIECPAWVADADRASRYRPFPHRNDLARIVKNGSDGDTGFAAVADEVPARRQRDTYSRQRACRGACSRGAGAGASGAGRAGRCNGLRRERQAIGGAGAVQAVFALLPQTREGADNGRRVLDGRRVVEHHAPIHARAAADMGVVRAVGEIQGVGGAGAGNYAGAAKNHAAARRVADRYAAG